LLKKWRRWRHQGKADIAQRCDVFRRTAVNIFEKALIIRPLLYRLPWSEIKVLFRAAANNIRAEF
jgi:hypothetical protein